MNKHLTAGLWIFSGVALTIGVIRHGLGSTFTNLAWMLVAQGLVHFVFCVLVLVSRHNEAKEEALRPTSELRNAALVYLEQVRKLGS